MSPYRARRSHAPDSAEQHRTWLSLIEVSGPFLSLPVLRATWPTLDALDKPTRERLRLEHTTWQADPGAGRQAWVDYVLRDLLGWADDLRTEDLDALSLDVPEHDTRLVPGFALVEPGEDVKPSTTRLIGTICEPGAQPTARIKGEAWAATPVDRLAQLCRHHDVPLGLATDGRWWALVWAPRGGVTTTAVFDAVAWPEVTEREVVRAFVSLLCRRRFFAVTAEEQLPALLDKSKDSQEEITEALGVQVRQAVELLVAAIGRADTRARESGEPGLAHVDAHDIYRGAVSVMMRVVFLLFAEERGLLPSDNELYARAYSAGRLCAGLERRALEGSEDDLEYTYTGWHRLLALFDAVYRGVEHPRLRMHAHDGSLFDPAEYPWMPLHIDDRTVLHMLRAVQYVEIGSGRSRERRTLSFRSLDVEQIGYVYEGLLSFDGFRADDLMVGLIGKPGLEEEVPLRDLESLAASCADIPALAAAIAVEYKDSRPGSASALAKKLAPPTGAEQEEARKRLLAVVRGDYPLAERLLPFVGVIRPDLRDLPVVVLPGELYVTESPLRKNTGTHYTPRHLAEQIVDGALEPLVYSPGPLQTADKDEWKLRKSDEILALKVADIAMGSAAFLVAAARYLGDMLIKAWTLEGDDRVRDYTRPAQDGAGVDDDTVVIEARRQIIEHCLYGVDINPMAVEMAKLSQWLVSMDPQRPFTFLDDRLVAGDSLLGITSLDQLEYMHLDPKKGRELHEDLFDWTSEVRNTIAEVADKRRKLAEIDGSTIDGLVRKREVLAEVERKTDRASLFADLTVGAALAYAGRGDRGQREGSLKAAEYGHRCEVAGQEVREQAREWLDTDLPDGAFRREPLHWPLIFPEVFEYGGFNAVIGNPPFLGGSKISGSSGRPYREYLVESVASGRKGNSDLVGYFVLRAHQVLNDEGQSGLIATNTLAQGDTREVGLDQIADQGATIRESIKSKPWPSRSVTLEFCAIWTSLKLLHEGIPRICDGASVLGITTSLDTESRVRGRPRSLSGSSGLAFQASKIDGIGFTMERQEAEYLISKDPKNAEVIMPFLNGRDLSDMPDLSARRWVVNFHDWPEARAREYVDCYDRVLRLVKPERDKNSRKVRRERWWQYGELARGLYSSISSLKRVIVVTLHTKALMPALVPTGQVFSHALGVFASDDTATLTLLSSAPHYWWAVTRGSTLETRIRYTPSDVFETFPLPKFTVEMRTLGDLLDSFRRDVMVSRDAGLTETYNLVLDSACMDEDIEELRRIHREIDEATIRAYGWEDRIERVGGLDHGFHKVGRETRYTIGPAAQREVLDSLLELNHERYAEEVAQGLHDKTKKARKSGGRQGALQYS